MVYVSMAIRLIDLWLVIAIQRVTLDVWNEKAKLVCRWERSIKDNLV